MKCALVGCGYWGEKVLSAMCEPSAQESRDLGVLEPFGKQALQRADFTLIGVYDSSLDNAQKARQAYPHLHIYPSYEALLADKQIEAIFLITPPASHFPLAKAALESKKHIFVEKPLALSSKECALLYELASKQGVVLHCDHIFLYAPAVQWLRAHIQEFGQIHSIHARRASLGRFQKEVSVVWDLALHDVAILAYVLGSSVLEQMKPCVKLVDVSGYLALADIGFSGAGEPHISIHTSWLSPKKVREMVIVGTRGVGVYDEVAENKLTLFSVDSVLGEQCGSVANFVKGTTAKVANLPQSLQSSHSPTAIPRILEESQAENETQTELESNFLDSSSPSLRADSSAWQSNSAQAESNQINGARKACNLESVALGLGAKGVKKEGGIRESSLSIQAPPSPLERTLSQAKLESSHTAQKVDSSVDCRADFQSARNDRRSAIGEKVDSRSEVKTLANSAKDSRICDEKLGLSSDWQGSYLSGNDRRQSCRIADLSRKAESSSDKTTPKTSKAQFSSQAELPATPPLISSIAHFYAQITQGQICPELAQHTIRVVQILEQIDAATLR